MPDILSSKFSFVRFEHPSDDGVSLDIPYSLPAYQTHDIAFQFIVASDMDSTTAIQLALGDVNGQLVSNFTTTPLARLLSYKYRLQGLNESSVLELFSIKIGPVTIPYNSQTVTYEQLAEILLEDWNIDLLEDYFVLPYNPAVTIIASHDGTTYFGDIAPGWHEGYISLSDEVIVQDEGSFTYLLLGDAGTILGYSNAFTVVDEAFYTSILTYSCDSDAFEFVYDGTLQNRVRIPAYLKTPDFAKTKSTYRKSSGDNQLLAALVEKEYALETEQMPEVFHECFTVALSHDSITLENVNIREKKVQLIEVDSYNPQWEGDVVDYPFAKGKGKVKISNYGYSNSNC